MWFNSTSMKWMVVHKPVRHKTARLFFTTILITFNNLPCVKGLKCRQNGGIVRCCTNFREVGDTCLPCIGSFGVNCTGGTCVEGFYGFGCREKCNCSIHEVCDHRIGCQKKASSTKTGKLILWLKVIRKLFYFSIFYLSQTN
ncbi:uncharacterized protein LOC133171811 [Saccostrea echinata]|uniref:uncharacterized protein LOC133171811 n=1 Tax=Saccostrea echinata TaxID=191078 RepID=UPI002A7F469F|nr:uncharacterized protein LOC133171811 [Saccostrea echinata]